MYAMLRICSILHRYRQCIGISVKPLIMRAKKRPTNFFIGQQHSTNNYFQSLHTFCERFFTYLVFFLLHEAHYISKYLNCCLWMQEREVSMWQWWNVFKAYFYRVLIRSHLLQDATEVVPSDRYTKSDL